MRHVIAIAFLAACTGGSEDTTDSGDAFATQFGDEGPVECIEGDPVVLGDSDVPSGYSETPEALLSARSGAYGADGLALVIEQTLDQARWHEGIPTDDAPANTDCPSNLSLVTAAELASDVLSIPLTDLWITVSEDGATTAHWSSLVYVEPPASTDDEPGSDQAELSDWTIDASLEPTDFVIDEMGTTEVVLWMRWDASDLGHIDAELTWYGVDGEGSTEQTTGRWALVR